MSRTFDASWQVWASIAAFDMPVAVHAVAEMLQNAGRTSSCAGKPLPAAVDPRAPDPRSAAPARELLTFGFDTFSESSVRRVYGRTYKLWDVRLGYA